MSNRIAGNLRLVGKILEGTPGIATKAGGHRMKDDAMSSSEIRRFLETYRSITSQEGLDVCKSVPLEILLTLLASGQMIMTDEEIVCAVDAPEANIMRWMKVLIERNVVTETEIDERKLYSLTPQCLSRYLVEI